MGEPIQILVLCRLAECSPASIVNRARMKGTPVLVNLDNVLVYWTNSRRAICSDGDRTASAPENPVRSTHASKDYDPPDWDTPRESEPDWDEIAQRIAEDEEREEFLDRIESGEIAPCAAFVSRDASEVDLENHSRVRIAHVRRWPMGGLDKQFGLLIGHNGVPGLEFRADELFVPWSLAVEVVQRTGEPIESVAARIRHEAELFAAECELARVKRELEAAAVRERWTARPGKEALATSNESESASSAPEEVDADSPAPAAVPSVPSMEWKPISPEARQARAEARARAAASFWHDGEPKPKNAGAWRPLRAYIEDRGISRATALAYGSSGRFLLHVFAGTWTVEYLPWDEAESVPRFDPARDRSVGIPTRVRGPVALDCRDLIAFVADLDSSLDLHLFIGAPFLQLEDADADAAEAMHLLDPPSVSVSVNDLWIGPQGQALLAKLHGDVGAIAEPLSGAADADEDALIRIGAYLDVAAAAAASCRRKDNRLFAAKVVAEVRKSLPQPYAGVEEKVDRYNTRAGDPAPREGFNTTTLRHNLGVALRVIQPAAAAAQKQTKRKPQPAKDPTMEFVLIAGLALLAAREAPVLSTDRRPAPSPHEWAGKVHAELPRALAERAMFTIDALSDVLGRAKTALAEARTREKTLKFP